MESYFAECDDVIHPNWSSYPFTYGQLEALTFDCETGAAVLLVAVSVLQIWAIEPL